MELRREQAYHLRDVVYSLDGSSQSFRRDALHPSERLMMLERCDPEGKFNPADFAPYEDMIKGGVYIGRMKEANQRFKEAKAGQVEKIIFEIPDGSERELLGFSEWASMCKPKK